MANLFDILAENDLDTEQTVIPRSPPGNPKVAGSSAAVLGEISLNTIHNRTPAARDSLAEKSVEDQTPPTAAQELHRKQLLVLDQEENRLPSNEEQLSKHLAATPIGGDGVSDLAETASGTAETMTAHEADDARTDSQHTAEADIDSEKTCDVSEVALGTNKDIVEQVILLSPANPASRIEDSFEALDELEEQLEAINEVAQFKNILSPKASKGAVQGTKPDSSAKATPRPDAATVKTSDRDGSVSRTSTTLPAKDGEKAGAKVAPRRSSVTRPTSLLPPKPPTKSSKPPTIPTFELPGEAVARRLKEQRQARLSMQAVPEKAPVRTSPARPKASKPPTRPNFELPGEAISRRKKQEHEEKLRIQEENERSRVKFKARPNRSSMAPSILPRETIASRARLNKGVSSENAKTTTSTTVSKRHSIAIPQMNGSGSSAADRPSLSVSQFPSRGRGSVVCSSSTAQISRTTSTSTGSVGKRSTMSAEELQRQKLRGKDIYTRDNSYTADRERERREREAAAKQARQEAAERSRQKSREWAEKQRLKKLAGSS